MNAGAEQRFRVLVVEDQQRYRELLVREIQAMGFDCHGAGNAREAGAHVEREGCEVVLLDLHLPDMDGMELFTRLRESGHGLQVVILTAYGSLDSSVQALRLQAADYLTKPCSLDEIERVLCRLKSKWRSERHETRAVPDSASTAAGLPTEGPDAPTLADVERELMLRTLAENDGHKPSTARQLGISLRTLYNKLKAYEHG